jgi:copper chaperone
MRTRIRIHGMSCNHCVRAVYTALTPVEGVTRLDLGIGWAEIEHDGRATIERLRDAIAVAGYEVVEEPAETRRRSLPLI